MSDRMPAEPPEPLQHSPLQPEELLARGTWARDLARRLLYDPSEADDVVQEAWIAAQQNPPRQPGALRAWLRSVIATLARQANRRERRRARRERAGSRCEALPAAGEVFQTFEQHRVLWEAVAALSEPYRTAVFLRYYEGLRATEIAQRMRLPDATVRSHVDRKSTRLNSSH